MLQPPRLPLDGARFAVPLTLPRRLVVLAGVVTLLATWLVPAFSPSRDVLWAIAAGFAAAHAFWQFGRRTAGPAALPVILWLGTLAIGMRRDRAGAEGAPWHEAGVVAVSGIALFTSLRPSRRSVMVLVVASVAVAAFAWWSPPMRLLYPTRHLDAAVAAGTLLAASLAARRRSVLAVVAAVVTLSLCWRFQAGVELWVRPYEYSGFRHDFEAQCWLVFMALTAGATSSGFGDDTGPSRGARLLVAAQRHPWITSTVIAVIVLACARGLTIWTECWTLLFDPLSNTTILTLLLTGFSFVAHVGRGGGDAFHRLAPWFAASVAGIFLLWSPLQGSHSSSSLDILLGLPVVCWPLASSIVMEAVESARSARVMTIVLLAALLLLPLAASLASSLAERLSDPASTAIRETHELLSFEGGVCDVSWAILVPLAFHAAVRSDLSSGSIAFTAAALGLHWSVGRFAGASGSFYYYHHRVNHSVFVLDGVVWTLAGLLVLAARRSRSLSAIPRDHPVLADFGATADGRPPRRRP